MAAAVLVLALPSSGRAADPRTMTFPPVEYHPPKAERVVFENGMTAYLLPDHELPLVRIHAFIRTGSVYEPADKVGLADLTGTVMRSGGSRLISGDELDEELEFMAANIGSMIGADAGFASLDVMARDLNRGLELFADMLMHPAFPRDKLELAKREILEQIRRRNDNPPGIANRAFMKLIYGEEHPLARESTPASIEGISTRDLSDFHAAYYHPNRVILAVSGDFETSIITEKLRAVFDPWPRGGVPLTALPPPSGAAGPSVYVVEKDLSQTTVRLGHLGIRQDDPDYFAVTLMDDILGNGGFRSRLFKTVRTRLGLAYSAGSVFTVGNLERGVFVVYCDTKAQSTHQAISAMVDEIRRIRSEPVFEDELRMAKDAFLNSFVFSFSDTHRIVNRQASLEYYGLPADFLDKFRDRVVTVSRADIQKVAHRHLRPEALILLVVGDPSRFDRSLGDFGEVHDLSLSVGKSGAGTVTPRP